MAGLHGLDPCSVPWGAAEICAGFSVSNDHRWGTERLAVGGAMSAIANTKFSWHRSGRAYTDLVSDKSSSVSSRLLNGPPPHMDCQIDASVEGKDVCLREYPDFAPPFQLEISNISDIPEYTPCWTIDDDLHHRLEVDASFEGIDAFLNRNADARISKTYHAEGTMTGPMLTQTEADALIAMEKHAPPNWQATLPGIAKGKITLNDLSKSEVFFIDIHRSGFELRKCTNQLRARKSAVLVRLDFGGRAHHNPDDEIIPCPHIHIYCEGYDDKWAYRISEEEFGNIGDFDKTLVDFLRYCNVSDPHML